MEALKSLARVPSRVAWRRLCEALDEAPEGLLTPALLARLDEALAPWPSRYRALPGRWARRLFDGEDVPALRLVRAVDLVVGAEPARRVEQPWASCDALANVEVLRLRDELLDDRAAIALAASTHLASVRDLALGTRVTSLGAVALSESPLLARLHTLDLSRNRLGAEGLRRLAASPHARGLRALHVGRNPLDVECARALAGASLRGLARLDLDCSRLTGVCVKALCESAPFDDLAELNLSNNPVGREGCAALARCEALGSLRMLYLHGCGLDDGAVAELLASPHLRGLRNLALSANDLTLASVDALAGCGALADLGELDVCHNRFDEAEARRRLGSAPTLGNVRRLCV